MSVLAAHCADWGRPCRQAGTQRFQGKRVQNQLLRGGWLAGTPLRLNWVRGRLRSGSTAGWLAVARKVVDTWFGGDPAAFLADACRCPGWTAFRDRCALCCPLRKLRVAVHVLLDVDAYGEDAALWLSMTQHRRLLPVDEPQRRADLAKRAYAHRWSARQLADAIGLARNEETLPCRRPGRPRM